MSNDNYGAGYNSRSTEDRSFMQAFDQLGPKTRAVLNDARIKWGPADLYFGGVVRRKMSDEALAELVGKNDATLTAKLVAAREAMQGVWAWDAPFKPAPNATLIELPKQPRRGSKAWVEAALRRVS